MRPATRNLNPEIGTPKSYTTHPKPLTSADAPGNVDLQPVILHNSQKFISEKLGALPSAFLACALPFLSLPLSPPPPPSPLTHKSPYLHTAFLRLSEWRKLTPTPVPCHTWSRGLDG